MPSTLMPSIDVAIPNYNYGRYLRECVESVLAQNINDVRILIIDNASTDNSLEVATDLASTTNNIFLEKNRTNMGMHGSFNKAVDWADAKYFLLLHADDLLAPGALQRAIDCLEKNPNVAMTYGYSVPYGVSTRTFDQSEEWKIESGATYIERRCLTAQNPVAASTAVLRTSAQKAAGYYDEKLSLTNDVELWLRVALQGDMASTTAVQGIIRAHADNASAYTRERLAAELKELEAAFSVFFAKDEGTLDVPRLRTQLDSSLAERAYWASIAHFMRGSYDGSWELAQMVFQRHPWFFLLPPIGYIFKRNDGIHRIEQVAIEAMKRLVHSRRSSE
jgi:GT2 family glycosyltransferase